MSKLTTFVVHLSGSDVTSRNEQSSVKRWFWTWCPSRTSIPFTHWSPPTRLFGFTVPVHVILLLLLLPSNWNVSPNLDYVIPTNVSNSLDVDFATTSTAEATHIFPNSNKILVGQPFVHSEGAFAHATEASSEAMNDVSDVKSTLGNAVMNLERRTVLEELDPVQQETHEVANSLVPAFTCFYDGFRRFINITWQLREEYPGLVFMVCSYLIILHIIFSNLHINAVLEKKRQPRLSANMEVFCCIRTTSCKQP
ncbi:unnamed protein product [Protopolystoma xenopodis]|uniref:Uncharacterized protein n=1 Tax=Protopolystoma xenopodis TaxID=117903 RepID=A0A3S5A6E4_9PLAT|nr:unnamed protein product [Protopolystoma xenopodis]